MTCRIHMSNRRFNGRCHYCRKAELWLLREIEWERNHSVSSWFKTVLDYESHTYIPPLCTNAGAVVLKNHQKRDERTRMNAIYGTAASTGLSNADSLRALHAEHAVLV